MYIRDLENITDGGSKTAFPWVIAVMSFDEGLSTVLTRNIVIYQVNVLLQPLQRVLSRKEASPCSPGEARPLYETLEREKVQRRESRHPGGPREEETNPFLHSFSEDKALLSVTPSACGARTDQNTNTT